MNMRLLLPAALACLLTGCYNDPDITMRSPGSGPERIHARPSVGPGTTSGGSTAGIQPAAKEQKEHTRAPERSETLHDQPGQAHMGAADAPAGQTPAHTAAPEKPSAHDSSSGGKGDATAVKKH